MEIRPDEIKNTPEVYGKHPEREFFTSELVQFPQVRAGMNPILPDLVESIAKEGMDYPISVALMTREQLSEYCDFANSLWKTDVAVESFGEPRDIYPVIIDGHTRTKAVEMVNEQKGEQLKVNAFYYTDITPEEFIAKQISGNIHSQPPPERRAIAIVEAYEYGIKNDKWKTPAEFQKLYKNQFSGKVLKEALDFAKLPQEVRDFVFAGKLYYGAGVELGRHADTVYAYARHRCGGDEAPNDVVDETYKLELSVIINKLVDSKGNKKGSLKRAKEIMNARINDMNRALSPPDQATEDQLFLDLCTSHSMDYLNALRKEHRESLAVMMKGMKFASVDYLALTSQLTGADYSQEIAELKRSNMKTIEIMAGVSIKGTGDTPSMF